MRELIVHQWVTADTIAAIRTPSRRTCVRLGVAGRNRGQRRRLLRDPGRRSRGQDHRQAIDLLRQVSIGGPEAARQLQWRLDPKDSAHYGVITLSGEALKSALRGACNLVTFSAGVLRQ